MDLSNWRRVTASAACACLALQFDPIAAWSDAPGMAHTTHYQRNLAARLRARGQELRGAAEVATRRSRALPRHADEAREKILPAMERGTTAKNHQDAR